MYVETFDAELISAFKGTIMQIWKFPYMFVFIQKYYPENSAFLILGILEIFFIFFYAFLFQFGLIIAPVQNTGLISAKYNNASYGTIITWYNK